MGETNPVRAFKMKPAQDATQWNAVTAGLAQAHILQTWQWGQVKTRLGWKALPFVWHSVRGDICAAALILQRTIPSRGFAARLRLFYVPRGPMLDWGDSLLRECVLDDLQALARRQGAIFIKIDPEVSLGSGVPGTPEAVENPQGAEFLNSLKKRGWLFSDEQIQFRNTVLIDLAPPEETLLGRMKPKTRYNIRLAERKGVVVRPAGLSDLAMIFKMYAETSLRDGFVIRDQAYYEYTWGIMLQNQLAEILLAEFESQALAAVVIFRFAGKAWYLNGMSRDLHREMMPNYLLQWEAMRRAKAAGCQVYDLWGAPDQFDETDPMWGVFRFKEGLGGVVLRTPGAWDYPVHPWLYGLYTRTLPRLLDVMRRRGRQQTRNLVEQGGL